MSLRGLLASPLGFLIGLSLGALGGGGSILAVPALVHRFRDGRAAVERARAEDWATRLFDRDTSLWSTDPRVEDAIADRLGWLDIAQRLAAEGYWRGTVIGTVIGIFILRLMRNGIIMVGVPGLAYDIFVGAIILVMIGLHASLERRNQAEG